MNKNQNTVDVSKTMYAAKALAILFVVTAHMNMKALNPVALAVKGRLGAMGVPVFLIISAYYFKPEKYSRIRDFMKRKVISIILPWLFWGSVVYSLALWRGNGYSFFSHMNFLLGNGSYLYYMNVLMICYLCFFYPAKNHWRHVITCLCAVSVFSCFLTLTGILKPVIIMLGITDYLNPFNWFVFFSLGLKLKHTSMEKLLEKRRWILPFTMVIWCILFVVGFYVETDGYGYFSKLGILMELLSTVAVLCISSFGRIQSKIMVGVGKLSFSIYLIHFLVIPVIEKYVNLPGTFMLISPIITLTICIVIIKVGDRFSKTLGIQRFYTILIGER
ncbi:acyltransferase [Hungatella hathewayi]|uniref:acyltransferase family protein n=1 Tax=Hungatella hathewayi TaxID=154046 RepID=UPI00033857F1|nr:acyltransferase [Hungatella hathewayi]CCZ58223.1 putative acyltransferase [Hungatella hathewayi CAG:224]